MICSGRNFGQSIASVWENGFSWWLDTRYLGGAKMSWTSGLFVFHVWMLLGFKLSLRINETCRRVTTIIFIRIHHSKHSRRNAPVLVIVFRINFFYHEIRIILSPDQKSRWGSLNSYFHNFSEHIFQIYRLRFHSLRDPNISVLFKFSNCKHSQFQRFTLLF